MTIGRYRRCLFTVCALIWLAILPAAGQDADGSNPAALPRTGASGLPLPRFVSLGADQVNMRVGPGDRFPIDWVYKRLGLPVEVINEHSVWRQIRDHEDTVGWVHQSLLSGRRRVLVTERMRILRARPDPAAPAAARLQPGVIGELAGCADGWCQIEVEGLSGWLRRDEVYGLYPDEQLR